MFGELTQFDQVYQLSFLNLGVSAEVLSVVFKKCFGKNNFLHDFLCFDRTIVLCKTGSFSYTRHKSKEITHT